VGIALGDAVVGVAVGETDGEGSAEGAHKHISPMTSNQLNRAISLSSFFYSFKNSKKYLKTKYY
jgi:hypothetical protein